MEELRKDNILALIENTPTLIISNVANRVKFRRLEKNWTQRLLASKAGIAFSTYRRFENTGDISFAKLVNIAYALGMESDFDALFSKRAYNSIEEVIDDAAVPIRKRGGRNG